MLHTPNRCFYTPQHENSGDFITEPSASRISLWSMIYVDIWWYMMLYDAIWWYMMIYDDIWWYMMIYDGIWWYMMIYDDIWWYMMIYDDIWWSMYGTCWLVSLGQDGAQVGENTHTFDRKKWADLVLSPINAFAGEGNLYEREWWTIMMKHASKDSKTVSTTYSYSQCQERHEYASLTIKTHKLW